MKVNPKNDDVRRVLRHPTAGKFRAEGAVDWPDDSFTARRIADGDITKEEEAPPEQQKQAEQEEEVRPEQKQAEQKQVDKEKPVPHDDHEREHDRGRSRR